jgi:hypothetical protein
MDSAAIVDIKYVAAVAALAHSKPLRGYFVNILKRTIFVILPRNSEPTPPLRNAQTFGPHYYGATLLTCLQQLQIAE